MDSKHYNQQLKNIVEEVKEVIWKIEDIMPLSLAQAKFISDVKSDLESIERDIWNEQNRIKKFIKREGDYGK